MTLRLNGSSSGYVELEVPADAGSHTLTLPDSGGSSGQYLQTDGNGTLSWDTVSTGKILQVKYANSTTAVNNITSDTVLLSVSLNPLTTTSKILVWGNSYAYVVNSGNGIACLKTRAHTSATATAGTQIATACFGSDSNQTFYASQKVQSVHAPGSTNTIVYSLVQGKGSQNTNYVNATDYCIYAMEVES